MKLIEFNKNFAVLPYENTYLFTFHGCYDRDFITYVLKFCKENKIKQKFVYLDLLLHNGIHNRSFSCYITNDYNFKTFVGHTAINAYILKDIINIANSFYKLYDNVLNIRNIAVFPDRILTYLNNYKYDK